MRKTSIAIAMAALILGACSDNEHEVNESGSISSVPSTPSAVMESMSGKEQGDQAVDSAMEAAEKSMDDTTDTAITDGVMDKAEEMTADSGAGDVMDAAAEMADDGVDAVKEMAVDSGMMDKAEEMMADTDGADMMDTAKAMAEDSSMMDKAEEMVDSATSGLAAVNIEDGTALAKKSGCFACHAIDRKILGPSWKDVAAKYADDKAAGKAHLLTKVAKGGKGVWADAGIVAPMPPYSPRVSDENIEILVDFVLGL